MHIIITLITAIAGLAWALYRLQNSGVDLNAFNPFYWARRRAWEKKAGTKPLHRLERPIDAATTLLTAVALQDGAITREQKTAVLEIFMHELKLNEAAALEAYALASHLLKDVTNIVAEIRNILAPSLDGFSLEQKQSLVELMIKVASFEHATNETQQQIIDEVKRVFGLLH